MGWYWPISLTHLVGWDICFHPMNEGGLGIKRSHHMNDTFLMKILWNLITKPDDLLCKVLYSKYGRIKDLRVAIDSKSYDSHFSKALTCILDQFQQNIAWQLNDGNNINFWMDKWAPSGTSLMSISNQASIDTTLYVRDVVAPLVEWVIISLLLINRILLLYMFLLYLHLKTLMDMKILVGRYR